MKYSLGTLLLFFCAIIFSISAVADDAPEASINKIDWDDTPRYIQQQAKTVVMHCSNGEYTANQVGIFQYSNKTAKQDNYILDFSAMKGLTQQLPGCNYNSPVCGPKGCFIMAYTQTSNNDWDQTWFGPALKIKIIDIEQNGKSFPAVEVTQAAESCLIVNGGKEPCPMHFTWKNKKFKYYGYAKLEAIEFGPDGNPAPGTVMPIINTQPDAATPTAPVSEQVPAIESADPAASSETVTPQAPVGEQEPTAPATPVEASPKPVAE